MDIESATVDLTEHLLRASRKKIIVPLETRLAKALKKRSNDPERFAQLFVIVALEAYLAGARHALAQLGPIGDSKALPIALIGPRRGFAQVATGEDSSVETVSAFEVSTAYHQGMKDLAGLWSAANGAVEVRLDPQPDACAICQEIADEGWKAVGTGDSPPIHPACKCSEEYRAAG